MHPACAWVCSRADSLLPCIIISLVQVTGHVAGIGTTVCLFLPGDLCSFYANALMEDGVWQEQHLAEARALVAATVAAGLTSHWQARQIEGLICVNLLEAGVLGPAMCIASTVSLC